jgi:hypothetical protein
MAFICVSGVQFESEPLWRDPEIVVMMRRTSRSKNRENQEELSLQE